MNVGEVYLFSGQEHEGGVAVSYVGWFTVVQPTEEELDEPFGRDYLSMRQRQTNVGDYRAGTTFHVVELTDCSFIHSCRFKSENGMFAPLLNELERLCSDDAQEANNWRTMVTVTPDGAMFDTGEFGISLTLNGPFTEGPRR